MGLGPAIMHNSPPWLVLWRVFYWAIETLDEGVSSATNLTRLSDRKCRL